VQDPEIHGSIDRMVAEEHERWQREAAGEATDSDRRARREAGQSPEGAELRPPEVVERYQQ
jgi:hypothetical protein